jgi:hypothetical protein
VGADWRDEAVLGDGGGEVALWEEADDVGADWGDEAALGGVVELIPHGCREDEGGNLDPRRRSDEVGRGGRRRWERWSPAGNRGGVAVTGGIEGE